MTDRPTPSDPHDLLQELLGRAASEAMSLFRHTQGTRKTDDTLVTEADRRAEEVLVEGLQRHFPQCGLVGEEGARVESDGPTWYIDPIDGTNAYVEGLAYWGPTVGLLEGSSPLVGAACFPRLNEYWFATRGGGAWLNGAPISAVIAPDLLRHCVVYIPSRFHRWFVMDFPGRARNLGSIVSHLALVAGGSAQAAFIPAGWSRWDVVGGLCLLSEVGAVARTLSGHPLELSRHHSVPFIVGVPWVVEELLKRVRFQPPAGD